MPESMHQLMTPDPSTVWIMLLLAIVVGIICVGALIWVFLSFLFEWLSQ